MNRIARYVVSLPERIVRTAAAVVGGTVHETAQVLLPRLIRRSRLYEVSAKNLLRILVEGVGAVEGSSTAEAKAPDASELAVRKGAGNVVELGSILAFGFSPLWLIAAASDVTHGSRVYLQALVDELKAGGVVAGDAHVRSVDELLGVLEGTSARTARLIDLPPLEVEELKTSLAELRDEAADLPSAEELARVYRGLRIQSARERRSMLEVSSGIGLAFLLSARNVSRTHLIAPYQEDWQPLGEEGFDERMQRTSHALAGQDGVWIFDPIAWLPALERIPELGTPAGVVQLLDRHKRDSAEVAAHFGVPHYEVPVQGIPTSGLEVVKVVSSRFWTEVAVWVPRRQTLVCADALGTAPYFRAGDERLGVHPLLRLKPPRVLRRYEPQHVLCGHGVGVHGPESPETLREALETARGRLPRAWIGALRPHRRTSD
jgi:hypothetical protein